MSVYFLETGQDPLNTPAALTDFPALQRHGQLRAAAFKLLSGAERMSEADLDYLAKHLDILATQFVP